MHLHFERNTNTKCDCSILSLSWMGKVPDDIPEDEGWKLNRTNYYQEGWLATGNVRGIVGVTFTTSHNKKIMDYPLRTNYNLRGHRSDVILVKWNEPYQKLASCDSTGIIFVWIKYEGRWSIELINDRNTPVTHFSWSHDGRMALICYQDGFVLVGSVAGQRYWSSMLNLDATITCGIWTPDDQQVYFGTTQGQVIVMDVHGAMVSQVQLCSDVGITSMAWSCEKFKMEESEETEPGVANAAKRTFVLAVSFQNGYIYLLKSFDDVSPAHINTEMNGSVGLVMEWSNSRELLAVAGSSQESLNNLDAQGNPIYENLLKFYTESGSLLYTARIPNSQHPVSALTWGHNDKRIFIATGTQVHIAWVSRRIASLQLLCRLQIQASISSEYLIPRLPLPSRIKTLIGNLFAQTIRCCVPDLKSLREFVSRPPACSTRLHCTMIRHDDESNLSSGTCYTLYLEYLGGLVPLLKGKRTSKIRPEFVIFDPQVDDGSILSQYSADSSKSSGSNTANGGRSDSSESELDDGCRSSPRMQRKRKSRQKRRHHSSGEKPAATTTTETPEVIEELSYLDTLPEEVKLVEVTSNIWGTKFKIHGIAKTVPSNLGQVTYKTSLLHLQPRQMTLVITELRDDFITDPDPNFNPNIFSEDEEEQVQKPQMDNLGPPRRTTEGSPPIAPMSPRPTRFTNRLITIPTVQTSATLGPLARAESYEDEFPYVDFTDMSSFKPEPAVNVPRPGPSYCSLVTQYSRSSSNSGQSRHAISPLCCEGSVPTLQSPKNAVAPSDIIFDRPPACQTTLMSYTCNNDYTNNVVQVKNALMSDQPRTSAHVNPVPLNLNLNLEKLDTKITKISPKKKDLQFIDEKTPSPIIEPKMQRTSTIVSISPANIDSMTRSCSAGLIDSFDVAPSDIAFSQLRKETSNKRLILVNTKQKKKNKKYHEEIRKPKLNEKGKSKSLDSCDLLQTTIEPLNLVMPKVYETSENDSDCSQISTNNEILKETVETKQNNSLSWMQRFKERKPCIMCLKSSPNTNLGMCSTCRKLNKKIESYIESSSKIPYSPKSKSSSSTTTTDSSTSSEQSLGESSSSRNDVKSSPAKKAVKKKTEVITSYTDSPLFSRKYRFNEGGSSTFRFFGDRTPLLGRKNKKDDTKDDKKKKDDITQSPCSSRKSDHMNEIQTIEVTPVETRTSVSLHTQALTTLENIISRLRDIDDGRYTPPSSPKLPRMPRSQPSSPAPSKKNKRHQSASPIRHLLNSPLLNRRQRKSKQNESSDDENPTTNGHEELGNSKQYRDLETFQKAQLRQKLKRGKIEPNGTPSTSQPAPLRREFVMHNKAPMWNESSQVYQLDFGGRVTQESAKNFQIEFRGKQVMQFGRIDGNAYTLDFQYPFSALQAFAVALANVTQRLK